jgi:hypothetical protein
LLFQLNLFANEYFLQGDVGPQGYPGNVGPAGAPVSSKQQLVAYHKHAIAYSRAVAVMMVHQVTRAKK